MHGVHPYVEGDDCYAGTVGCIYEWHLPGAGVAYLELVSSELSFLTNAFLIRITFELRDLS